MVCNFKKPKGTSHNVRFSNNMLKNSKSYLSHQNERLGKNIRVRISNVFSPQINNTTNKTNLVGDSINSFRSINSSNLL